MVEEKMKSSAIKKKKTKSLPIILEELEISQDDVLCCPDFIFETIHEDENVLLDKPVKKSTSMKKKKVEPLKLYEDDLALYPTDVLIVPHSVSEIFKQNDLYAPKVTLEQHLLEKERLLIMKGGRDWEKRKMSWKFLKKGRRPRVWKIPGLIRGSLQYLSLVKLPRYWHKFEQPHAKLRHHTTMPTETYQSLFLNCETKTPVHFLASATNLNKPQGTSKPTISTLWTKGPTPQVIDYDVFNHDRFGINIKKRKDAKTMMHTAPDIQKRVIYAAKYFALTGGAIASQLVIYMLKTASAFGRLTSALLLRIHFKIRYQFIPVAIFTTRRFLRAHIEFIYLILHSSAHVIRWVKRNLRPLTF